MTTVTAHNTTLCNLSFQMFFDSTADNVRDRIKEWWCFSLFNRMDALIYILAIVGFILRFFPSHFVAAKNIYGINCIFLFLRILRNYAAGSELGPKMVMITKMVCVPFCLIQLNTPLIEQLYLDECITYLQYLSGWWVTNTARWNKAHSFILILSTCPVFLTLLHQSPSLVYGIIILGK